MGVLGGKKFKDVGWHAQWIKELPQMMAGEGMERMSKHQNKVVHYVWIRSFEVLIGGTYLMFVDLLNMSSVLLYLSCLVFALMERPEI